MTLASSYIFSRSIDTCQPIGGDRSKLVLCVCYVHLPYLPYMPSAKSLVGLDSNWLIPLLIVFYVFYKGILDYSVLPIAGRLATEK